MIPYKVIIIIGSISDFSELLPISFFLFKKKTKKFPFLLTALLCAATINITSFILSELDIYNLYLYPILGLVELTFIYIFYTKIVPLARWLKITFLLVLGIYIAGSWYEGFDQINALSRSISCLYLLILGIYYLYSVYRKEQIENIFKYPEYWINAALLFYFSASFFTFLMSKKILSLEITDFFSAGWLIHMIANIIKNIMVSIALSIKNSDD